MSFRKYASTDEQEEALAKVEEWAKKIKFRLFFGTTIGKSPQTVILDHSYQDGIIHINRDGKITMNDEEICSLEQFKNIVEQIK